MIFDAFNPEHVKTKSLSDKKLSKNEGHISYTEKDYIDFQLPRNKQSLEEFKIQRSKFRGWRENHHPKNFLSWILW